MEQQMFYLEKREGEPQMWGICYEWNDGEHRWNDMFI